MTSMMATTFCLTVSALIAPASEPLVETIPLQAAGLSTFWEARLPLVAGDTVENAYLIDEALYATTDLGDVFSLKADVGLLRWGFNVTEADYRIFRPTHVVTQDNAGPVVIPTTTEVLVFDRFSGEQLDRFRPEFVAGSSAVAYDHRLFMGSSDGKFYSLVFNHPKLGKPFKRWDVLAGGPVTASPLLYDRGWLLFASQSGTVFSCGAADKKLNWSYRTGSAIIADPALDATGVYVGSTDRSLYKLDRTTGTPLWRVRFPSALREGPVVMGDTVYQYCIDQGVTAINASDGSKRWRHAMARTVASHSGGGDVLFTSDRRIEIVDPATGKVGASISAPKVAMTIPNPQNDAVYLFGARGRVLCLRVDDVPYLRRQQVAAARAQLNASPSKKKPKRFVPDKSTDTRTVGDDPLRSKRDHDK